MLKRFGSSSSLSLALETNGRGYMGFIAELPGAYVRGKTEEEAVSKVNAEAFTYRRWLGFSHSQETETRVVQRHFSKLMVEDADNEILLEDDKNRLGEEEFSDLVELTQYSGRTFRSLYSSVRLKSWVDPGRIRKTFYGDTPKTIQEIFDHVNNTQQYYLSRIMEPSEPKGSFVRRRNYCLGRITLLFEREGNETEFRVDNELWTIRKVLRRFVWHDRIHGKAMVRILKEQERLGLISEHLDPFGFFQDEGRGRQ